MIPITRLDLPERTRRELEDQTTLAHLRRPETLALAAEVFTTSAADW